MGKMKKKFESGEGSLYLTRKQALRKLQLSLKMFRRLCILKGIYPREPKNRKKAQHGSTEKKTLYLKKDIQFLLHEPIVWKLREHKVYLKKKSRARQTRDYESLKRIMENKPTYTLDHIVKERYPTFVDALRDMDDCLTLAFLFSTFPSMRFVPATVSNLCRRLTLEFLHFVIETRSLRKVFVSIKGYYYQADIKGQTVTWIMPHTFGFQPQSPDEVDFRIMATFVEFYSTLLGFVNFRLFHGANICYPPKLTTATSSSSSMKVEGELTEEELVGERIASLNQSIIRIQDQNATDVAAEIDEFPTGIDSEKVAELKKELERVNRLKNLFNGLKVFLNREVPRESLTFCIRAFGGQVSWDTELFPGATFSESDESITHQITDRDVESSDGKQYLSRYYIQPQWIFDSVNHATLLPVENYFQGAVLPPHVSPFVTEREGDYVPPEKRKFIDMEKGIVTTDEVFAPLEQQKSSRPAAMEPNKGKKKGPKVTEEAEPVPMAVERAMPEEIDELKQKEEETKEEYRLRVMMIRNKHKRLYKKMMESRRKRRKEADKMVKKREAVVE